MSTIIDNGDGSFIAGDPPTVLPAGYHWCSECRGTGLVDSHDEGAYYDVCTRCSGGAILPCDCPKHPMPGKKSWTEIYASLELASLADQLTNARDRFAVLRDLNRYDERRDIARARLSALEAGYCALASVVSAIREDAGA